jgi:hypothetical protein
VSDWNCYGFKWLGKFFVDTTTVFGSKTAPASFDSLPETLVNIVCSVKRIPKAWVHRQLDDVPIVSPLGSGLMEAFTKGYSQICKDLNVPLAENCPNHDKAFGPSMFGTVLGVGFDTEKLEWYILRKFESDGSGKKLIPQGLIDDLWVWKKVINSSRLGLPLTEIFETSPFSRLHLSRTQPGRPLNGRMENAKIFRLQGTGGWLRSAMLVTAQPLPASFGGQFTCSPVIKEEAVHFLARKVPLWKW